MNMPGFASDMYNNPVIYITENGFPQGDPPSLDDTQRWEYFRQTFQELFKDRKRRGVKAPAPFCNFSQWWHSVKDSSRLAPQPSLDNSPLERSCSENAATSTSVTRAARYLLQKSWQLTMKSSRFPFRSFPGSRGIVFLLWFSTRIHPFVHDQ
ncbi:uncharacterized protein LOC120582786 isoform X2 [Pteropus medius]|uniref:uncharacterized protein LOC120582786 isoform X2 n=1 Tax=Pteropus vampyrus TaxID=132908 RepID=UPI00196ACD26|nr:uncharacterized protein LOC120582786 isoform X2 [Pteropus giganteus]